MSTAIARSVLVALTMLSIACGRSMPTAPTTSSQLPDVALPPVPPVTNLPPLTGPSRTFTFDHELASHVASYTQQSRFVLYDNGAFALQYPSLIGDYRGGYTDSNGVITFQWEGWSTAGAWGATGTIKDGSLTVQYNLIMQLSDFEDAAYRLQQ